MYKFIEILKEKYDLKKAKNSRYSQRAYSAFLSIDSGTLSSLLKGKRVFPISKIDSFITKLDLSEKEKREFIDSVIQQRKDKEKVAAPKKSQPRSVVHLNPEDYFHIITEWEYAAIFSLLELEDFSYDKKWISNRLGISLKRCQEVLDCIDSTDIITINKKGKHKLKKIDFHTTDDIESKALRLAHRNELDMGKKKLDQINIDHRYFYSYTFPMNSKKTKRVKDLIRKLQKELSSSIDPSECDSVYQLNMQLFPLTNDERFLNKNE